jgi:signal transduction histidine kinase
LRTELTLIERHSRIILERKPIVDRLVRDILATTTTGAQLAVERRYAQLEARALGATIERRHWILALLLGAVIFGMLEVMGSMQRAARTKEKLALELQAAHERLEREHQRELELGAARIRFLAMTSHEIRTPLTTIVSSTEMLMAFGSKWGAERNRDHFERIRVAAEGMKRMVEDILLIGRAEAGNLTSSPAPILLNAFCQELVETFEQQSQGARVIHYEFEGDASVSLDERLLRHVLGNLLSNALKCSAADSEVLLVVRVGKKSCEFLLRDRGIGIPAEYMPNLYQSYYRAKNAEHLPGSGLGLAVVYRAVTAQGGTIECESREGKGTSFLVKLPKGEGK